MDTAEQILAQLDDAARDYRFADPEHPYSSAIDARLHVFRDDSRWALLIELVGYNPRAGNVVDVVHAYGNCLTRGRPGCENEDFLSRIDNMDEIEDIDNPEYLQTDGGPIEIRGRRVPVEAAAGDPLEDVFRLLVPSIVTCCWPTRMNCGVASRRTCRACSSSTSGGIGSPNGTTNCPARPRRSTSLPRFWRQVT
ncbi:hypothetical protein AB0H43_27590 [Hamadaea sp. NPDC050747]|uniref:DUF7003 family protein n=1 Tax=Hamadaea sp. NPDC050747 TaxID=3155789 RepID=UPI0034037EBD